MQHLPEAMQDTIPSLAEAIYNLNFQGVIDAEAHLETQLGASTEQLDAIQNIAYRRLLSQDPEWCDRIVAKLRVFLRSDCTSYYGPIGMAAVLGHFIRTLAIAIRKSNFQAALCQEDQLHSLLSFLDIFVLRVKSEWCQFLDLPDSAEDHFRLIHQIELYLTKNKHLGPQLVMITNKSSWKRYWRSIRDSLVRHASTSQSWGLVELAYVRVCALLQVPISTSSQLFSYIKPWAVSNASYSERLSLIYPDSLGMRRALEYCCIRCAAFCYCGLNDTGNTELVAASKSFKFCSACSTAMYCGRQCALADWSEHKRKCYNAERRRQREEELARDEIEPEVD